MTEATALIRRMNLCLLSEVLLFGVLTFTQNFLGSRIAPQESPDCRMNSTYIELATACNFYCRSCYNASGGEGNHMPHDSLFKLLDELLAVGFRRIIFSSGGIADSTLF